MSKRFYIILITLTLGLFLMPSEGYACETKTEKSCCKKLKVQEIDKKDCCDNTSNDKDNGCNGKCGHTNCSTTFSSISLAIITFFDIKFTNNCFDFTTQKSNFYHSETFISSGFTSVWLPPKI